MATSSVPRVKARLLTVMQTALTTLNAQGRVTWAHPGESIGKEAVFMGDAKFESETTVALRSGAHQQDEHYNVPVVCDVTADGNDAQAAEERAYAIAGSVEDAIRADQTLGALTWTDGAVIRVQVEGKEPMGYQSDQTRYYAVVVNVNVHARI